VASPLITVAPDEVHLWITTSERVPPSLLTDYRRLLDDGERARADRFVFPHDRDAFTIAHALVRCALSRYAAVAPSAWSFVANAHGRPQVRASSLLELDFNLSHSDGIAVCLVGRGVLGVDVEHLGRAAPVEIADDWFAPSEARALALLPLAARPRRFYEYWTLKEAYIKARGLGLTLPLDAFAFSFEGARPRIAFAPPIDDDAARWWFTLLDVTANDLVAVALRDGPADVRIVARELVPLVDELP
jgi:4'-phosphopantetheinyl transferase